MSTGDRANSSTAVDGTNQGEPRIAVSFDLDRTIIEGSSISQFGSAAWRAGVIDMRHA